LPASQPIYLSAYLLPAYLQSDPTYRQTLPRFSLFIYLIHPVDRHDLLSTCQHAAYCLPVCLSASLPVCLFACLFTQIDNVKIHPAYPKHSYTQTRIVRIHLPASLPICPPAAACPKSIPTHRQALSGFILWIDMICLPTCQPAYLSDYLLPAYPQSVPTHIHTLPRFSLFIYLICLPTREPACLSAHLQPACPKSVPTHRHA
jgi:hypothetical protein